MTRREELERLRDTGALWLPIATAPKDGTKIRVVSVENGEWFHSAIAWWDDTTGQFENGEYNESWVLTYWQPIDAGKAFDALIAHEGQK